MNERLSEHSHFHIPIPFILNRRYLSVIRLKYSAIFSLPNLSLKQL